MGSIALTEPTVNGINGSCCSHETVPASKLSLQAAEKSSQTVIKAPRPNPSLQVTADHRLKAVEAPVYAPGAGEVLLHVKATGICGYVNHMGISFLP